MILTPATEKQSAWSSQGQYLWRHSYPLFPSEDCMVSNLHSPVSHVWTMSSPNYRPQGPCSHQTQPCTTSSLANLLSSTLRLSSWIGSVMSWVSQSFPRTWTALALVAYLFPPAEGAAELPASFRFLTPVSCKHLDTIPSPPTWLWSICSFQIQDWSLEKKRSKY